MSNTRGPVKQARPFFLGKISRKYALGREKVVAAELALE